ncbi:hypothetical protein ACUNV4_29580 [Granulosicoccus sp. 3-233]|uniref:hypothetical protein n=1 Tax=Granulosicoccus sp. 3-233 TaxID=3417969 RepID=UPI003D3533E4
MIDHRKGTGLRQKGSASVEYVVLTLIVVGVLFLPLPGLGESLVNTLVSALRQFQANTTYLLSLP